MMDFDMTARTFFRDDRQPRRSAALF